MQSSKRQVWYEPVGSRRDGWKKRERRACKKLMIDLKRLRGHDPEAVAVDDDDA